MNIDDVEFLLVLLSDLQGIQTAHVYSESMNNRIERARTILGKYVYRTKEDKQVNPRQQELNFNDYRDWHSELLDDDDDDTED